MSNDIKFQELPGDRFLNVKEVMTLKESDLILCGVYFLLSKDELIYIGASKNIKRRISEHKKDKEFDSVRYIRADENAIDFLESFYIHDIKPPLNTEHKAPISLELMSQHIYSGDIDFIQNLLVATLNHHTDNL